MSKKFCSAMLTVLLTLSATAQNNPSPAASSAAPSTLVGCVQKTGDVYTLSDETSKATAQLRGHGLKNGRHAQVTGTLATNASPAGGATEVLDISSIKYVAGSCKAGKNASSSYVASPSSGGHGKLIGAVVMGVIITGVAVELISRQGEARGGK